VHKKIEVNHLKKMNGNPAKNLEQQTMNSLSCYHSVKRDADNNGNLNRPPVAPLYMDVSFIGDRSGSMASTNGGSETGAREYIKKQVDASKTLNCQLGYYIDFTTFDDRIERPFSGEAVEVSEAVLDLLSNAMKPRGSTRYYDAIIQCVSRQMKRLEDKYAELSPEVQDLVKDQPWLFGAACTPMTDGYDNQSAVGAQSESVQLLKNFVDNYSATAMVLGGGNLRADVLATNLGLDADAGLQMGVSREECQAAMNSAATAQLRCTTSGGALPPPEMGRYFSQLERETSCSQGARIQSCPATLNQLPQLNRSTAMGSSALNHALRVPAAPMPRPSNFVVPPPPTQPPRL